VKLAPNIFFKKINMPCNEMYHLNLIGKNLFFFDEGGKLGVMNLEESKKPLRGIQGVRYIKNK
jgi:hypothetical protein